MSTKDGDLKNYLWPRPDDEGMPSTEFGAAHHAQDDNFMDAMREAIRKRKESVTEGVKVADASEARVIRQLRAPPTAPVSKDAR
jgi:hypothetical protein